MEKKEDRILSKQFKKAIVNDLSTLNGTQFEDFCTKLFAIILSLDDIIHKGCNLNGKPVPYAVDFKTETCKIVGQCGTDEDYFTNKDFEKPMGDIQSTTRNNPLCETLYLFSNQRVTDSKNTGLVTKINALNPPFAVKIFDAERIADIIYEEINNPRCAEIWQYLINSYQFYAIYPKRNCFPPSSPHYIPRMKESQELQKLLETQSLVEVVGVSGIGKSEFAKQVAKEVSQYFDALFWIDGKDYANLESIKLCQFGYEVNVKYVLENKKCLLIFDNLNENVVGFSEAFSQANKHGSKCIITSLKQNLNSAHTYQFPYMEADLSEKYIDSFGLHVSEQEKKELITLVAGYPLAINMICTLLKDNVLTVGELLSDEALQDLEDEHNQRLSKRIIGKIYNKYADELDLLAYIDSLVVSSEYLQTATNRIRFTYLQKYSIIQQDAAYTFRIHQVVLGAIQNSAKHPDIVSIAKRLCEYLDEKNRLKDIPFFTLFHYNGSFIDKVYQDGHVSEEQKKVILYSQLQAENTFSDADKYLSLIAALPLRPSEELYDCLLLADKYEIQLSATPQENYNEQASAMIDSLKEELDKTTKEDIRFELLHHIGKLFMKMRDTENARIYLERALAIRPKAYATLLQLARLSHFSKTQDTQKASEYVSSILEDSHNGENVPLTIILACYSMFLSKKAYEGLTEKYIENNFDEFSRLIMTSLLSFDNQAVPTLGSFAFSLAYKNPEFMRMALAILHEPPSISDKAYIQAYANLKAVEYKLENDKSSKEAESIFASAKYYFGLQNLEKNEGKIKKDYQRKRYMELLMDAGKWEEVIDFSACYDDKESEFYLQLMAKVYQNLGNYEKAIEYIDKAISTVKDADYSSSFLWNKACILHDKGDASCLDVIKAAIEMRKDDKAKNEWIEQMKSWSDGSQGQVFNNLPHINQ